MGWDRAQELVVVFETNDRGRLEAATEMLEREGIPFSVSGQLSGPIEDVNLGWYWLRRWSYSAKATFRPPPRTSPDHCVQLRVLHGHEKFAKEILSRVV